MRGREDAGRALAALVFCRESGTLSPRFARGKDCMRPKVRESRGCRCLYVLFIGLAAIFGTQAVQGFGQEKTAEEEFKNIQVFKGLPASQIIPAMSFMRAALGVNCTYCHVEEQFDKDTKEEKEAARKMILMVRDINKANFDGRNEVTCNTCHHGEPHPVGVPSFAEFTAKAAPQSHEDHAERRPSEPLPGAAEVIEKYVAATGGKSAIEKINTMVMKGNRTTSEGGSTPLEVFRKAPNRILASYGPNSAFSIGFDGTTGWSRGPRGVRDLEGPNLARIQKEADMQWALKLQEEYRNLRVIAKQAVDGRDAYVVQGVTVADKKMERFYFDAQTGLLLRIATRDTTPLGPLPDQMDFDDYRDVQGVKLPFTVSHMRPDRSYKDTFSEVTLNVPVDDTKFEKPSEPPKQTDSSR